MTEQLLYQIGAFALGCIAGFGTFYSLRQKWLSQALRDLDGWRTRIKERISKYEDVREEIWTDVEAMSKTIDQIKKLVLKRFR
jgi:hypothetical protein